MQNSMVIFNFSVSDWKFLFFKFGPKTQNHQFKLKSGIQTNSKLQSSMVMFPFFIFDQKHLFQKIWSRKSKFPVQAEICYLDLFEYVEFNGNVHFFSYRSKMPFWGKFGLKYQSCQFKLKLGASINLNMYNSTEMITLFFFE